MDIEGTEQSLAWPLPKFYFEVKWGDHILTFQEISGLDVETQPIEYRHSNSQQFSTIKMPGISKISNVTMKRGIFTDGNKYWDWINQIEMNTAKRETVTISLLDETGAPTMVWTLGNVWVKKITAAEPISSANDVAIESIELVHEGLTISNG